MKLAPFYPQIDDPLPTPLRRKVSQVPLPSPHLLICGTYRRKGWGAFLCMKAHCRPFMVENGLFDSLPFFSRQISSPPPR